MQRSELQAQQDWFLATFASRSTPAEIMVDGCVIATDGGALDAETVLKFSRSRSGSVVIRLLTGRAEHFDPRYPVVVPKGETAAFRCLRMPASTHYRSQARCGTGAHPIFAKSIFAISRAWMKMTCLCAVTANIHLMVRRQWIWPHVFRRNWQSSHIDRLSMRNAARMKIIRTLATLLQTAVVGLPTQRRSEDRLADARIVGLYIPYRQAPVHSRAAVLC